MIWRPAPRWQLKPCLNLRDGFAEDGKKCMLFSLSCQALGVLIDSGESHEGRAFISNTQPRIVEFVAALDEVVAQGSYHSS